MATKNLGTTGVLYTDRRVFYPDPMEVAEDYPSQTPFLSMLSSKGFKSVPDADYKLFEYNARYLNPYVQIDEGGGVAWSVAGAPGDAPASTITVDVSNNISLNDSLVGLQFEVYDSTYVSDPTAATYKGHVLCTAFASNEMTLKSLGKSTDASHQNDAFVDDDVLVVIGPAGAEGGSAFKADNDELEVVWNSTQDFRTSVKITTALRKAALRGENDELARERMKRWLEHKQRIDYSLWRGIRAKGTGMGSDTDFVSHITDADGNVVRTTMGVATALARYGATSGADQNLFTVNQASYTWSDFVDQTEQLFRFNPGGTLVGFAGPKYLSYLAKLSHMKLDGNVVELSDYKSPGSNSLGIKFRELYTEHGLIRIIPTYAFAQSPLAGDMYVMEEDACDLRNFEEASAFYTNILTDDNPRVIKDEYYSNLGLGIRQIKKLNRMRLA